MSNVGQIAVGWISRAHPPCVANKVGAIFKVDALRLSTLRGYVFGGRMKENQLNEQTLEYTIPDKPNSRLQQYRLTEKAKLLLATSRKGSQQ